MSALTNGTTLHSLCCHCIEGLPYSKFICNFDNEVLSVSVLELVRFVSALR
jgi:hypothetical protein